MPWKTTNAQDLAESHGFNYKLIQEKIKLIETIKKARKAARLTQADLAKRAGVTQGRIAQIETGMGGQAATLEVMLGLLQKLGYDCHIVTKKAS